MGGRKESYFGLDFKKISQKIRRKSKNSPKRSENDVDFLWMSKYYFAGWCVGGIEIFILNERNEAHFLRSSKFSFCDTQ